jgi:hypothetical protein
VAAVGESTTLLPHPHPRTCTVAATGSLAPAPRDLRTVAKLMAQGPLNKETWPTDTDMFPTITRRTQLLRWSQFPPPTAALIPVFKPVLEQVAISSLAVDGEWRIMALQFSSFHLFFLSSSIRTHRIRFDIIIIISAFHLFLLMQVWFRSNKSAGGIRPRCLCFDERESSLLLLLLLLLARPEQGRTNPGRVKRRKTGFWRFLIFIVDGSSCAPSYKCTILLGKLSTRYHNVRRR